MCFMDTYYKLIFLYIMEEERVAACYFNVIQEVNGNEHNY